MDILQNFDQSSWESVWQTAMQATALAHLEQGGILFFPHLTFHLNPEEHVFLSDIYGNGKSKNISYNCHDNSLRGVNTDAGNPARLKTVMQRFNQCATKLINQTFPAYAAHLQVARTSYRPAEVYGRKSPSLKKDDTRLHVDAFPASPVQGRRILRVFTNINPYHQDRIWQVGEKFDVVVKRFLEKISRPFLPATLLKILKVTKNFRTHYDHVMLQLHDRMKQDEDYQKTVKKKEIKFPANTTWIVNTDVVSHAALAGQFLLEQTFYLPVDAMVSPQLSPLRILEKAVGRQLV